MEVPFILVKKIEKLRFMAFLGVSGIMVFVITFAAFYIVKISNYEAGPGNPDMALFPTDWF
jgi:heme/copper-type cytochrome/quinol oxidase subunit 3